MCSLVDEQVQNAIKAVEEDNLELAQSVIDRDKKVNKYDVKIDKICQRIFAISSTCCNGFKIYNVFTNYKQ